MKKITILSILAFLCFATSGFSQSGFGIKAGLNFNKISTNAGSLSNNIKESLASKTGYNFGVFGRLGKDKIFFQPELVVAGRSGQLFVTQTSGGAPVAIDIKYTNLDVPLLLGIKPVNFLRIMAGPVASLRLSEDQKLRDALKAYATGGIDNVMNSTSYGYQVGVGTRLLGFEIDLRKEGSLSDIAALNLAGNQKFSQKASGWQLTIAKKIL